jgi:Domain of unknown function (DUF1998)
MTQTDPKALPSIRTSQLRKSEVGELRPSQVLISFGIGSLVDLPNLSVLVMGLEDWPIAHSTEISEERLLASVQKVLGAQTKKLLTPPRGMETIGARTNWFDEANQIGMPVAPFPRWLVCSRCRILAPLGSGLFEAKVFAYRPDKTKYVHNCTTQGAAPTALPSRFMAACPNGHLDDFAWLEFVHRGPTECKGPLYLYEIGASGEAADVEVECRQCNRKRRMAEAFGRDNAENMPPCRGRRPHLRDMDHEGCDVDHVRPILQGASNSWFPVTLTALSIPQATNKLAQLVEDHWAVLDKVTSGEVLAAFRAIGQLREFTKYTDAQVWEAIQKKQQAGADIAHEPTDIKSPEWNAFSDPASAPQTKHFRLKAVDPPEHYAPFFERIVLVERLREVRALIGFTRIDSPRDFDTPFDLPNERRAPLSRQNPTWVPANETNGEGIFFHFSEMAIKKWMAKVGEYEADFKAAHERWRATKNLDPTKGYPGLRYVLIHTFSHAIIRQLSVECGYTTASIAERIYSQDGDDARAGVLIYTAAPDSEGTLGGLCALGDPRKLGRHLEAALGRLQLCASDPLCAEHKPSVDTSLHGAACHACSFLPETCCERGNKYLDRSLLVKTVERGDLAFFE